MQSILVQMLFLLNPMMLADSTPQYSCQRELRYNGSPFLPKRPKCIPIVPITFEWDSKSRQQLPLQLIYAITIHKSQGQTLGKTVVDISKSEISSGCTFVALSRLKTLKDGILQPMSLERLQSIGKAKRMTEGRNEERRLQQLFAEMVNSVDSV